MMQRSAPDATASLIATASVVCPGLVPPMTTTCLSSSRETASLTLSGMLPETGMPASARLSRTIVAFSLVAAMPILSKRSSESTIGLASSIPSRAATPPPTTMPNLSSIATRSLTTSVRLSSQACLSSTSGLSKLPPRAATTFAIDGCAYMHPFNACASGAVKG